MKIKTGWRKCVYCKGETPKENLDNPDSCYCQNCGSYLGKQHIEERKWEIISWKFPDSANLDLTIISRGIGVSLKQQGFRMQKKMVTRKENAVLHKIVKSCYGKILSTIGVEDCESCIFFGECLDEELRVYRERQKMGTWVREKK